MWSRATEGGAHSLRRRLLGLVLAAVALASLLQAASAYRFALRHADALFDAQLQAIAREVEQGAAPGGGLPARSTGTGTAARCPRRWDRPVRHPARHRRRRAAARR